MLDWKRKYLSDLAWVAKECAHDSAIAFEHRDRFAHIYKLAKLASTAPAGSIDSATTETVAELCSACRTAGLLESCRERTDWQANCPLITKRLQI